MSRAGLTKTGTRNILEECSNAKASSRDCVRLDVDSRRGATAATEVLAERRKDEVDVGGFRNIHRAACRVSRGVATKVKSLAKRRKQKAGL